MSLIAIWMISELIKMNEKRKRIKKVLILKAYYALHAEKALYHDKSSNISLWIMLDKTLYDINIINITGLDRRSFNYFLCHFAKYYNEQLKTHLNGRPRKLEMHQILGLLLSFYSDTMSLTTLWVNFGIPPCTASLDKCLNLL